MNLTKTVSVALYCLVSLTAVCEAQGYKAPAVVVSYESSTAKGLRNRDSATAAMRRLGVVYDSLDRTTFGPATIDYTPWDILVWSTGDPTQGLSANPSLGVGALSLKEISEISKFLMTVRKPYKKALVIAGQNIAYYNDFSNINQKGASDTAFMHQMLHTKYLALTPVTGGYHGFIQGGVPVYFTFTDSLDALSPNVVGRTFKTPSVAPEVTAMAYNYQFHPAYPPDSGAGVAYYGPLFITTFFAFDWADPSQKMPSEAGLLTSGATRVLRGALDFIQSVGSLPLGQNDPATEKLRCELEQNFPNPVNSSTTIGFSLESLGIVSLRILDEAGKSIRTLINSRQFSAGRNEITLNLDHLPSGTYVYELTEAESSGKQITVRRKMIIAR